MRAVPVLPPSPLLAPLSRVGVAWLGVVLAVALGLRLTAAQNPILRAWDEAHHALVAKHLAAHPLHPTLFGDAELPHDDSDWQRAHTWVHKPPLALWTMAASIAALGPTPLGARLPSVLLDTLAVLLTFLIGRRLFDTRIALFSAAAHALLGNALLLTCGFHPSDHVDLQLAFWVELSVWFAVVAIQTANHRWLVAFGLAAGAALLTKSFPGLLAVAAFALGAPGPRARRIVQAALAAVGGLVLALPWTLYARAQWPDLVAMEATDQLTHLWTVSQGHGGHPAYHLEKLGEMHGVLAYLPVGWFLWSARSPDWRLRFVALWWLIPLLVFSLSPTKMMNYLAPAAPAVCLMMGTFVSASISHGRTWRVAALGVVAAALVSTGRDLERSTRVVASAEGFRRQMAALPPRSVLLNVKPFLQAMYFGAHAAYPEVWSSQEREHARLRGYQVLVACSDSGPALGDFCERPAPTVLNGEVDQR